MTRVRPTTVALAVACLLAGVAAASADAAVPARPSRGGALELSLDRTSVSTRLGKSFGFNSAITNRGRARLTGFVAHLNIVSLTRGVYVDPEDWSDQRTRYLAPLEAGRSTNIDWKVKAVNDGEFAVYVAVVPTPATAPPGLAVSSGLDARVSERRTLNSEGILPLALGVPALLGLAAIGLRVRRRRS